MLSPLQRACRQRLGQGKTSAEVLPVGGRGGGNIQIERRRMCRSQCDTVDEAVSKLELTMGNRSKNHSFGKGIPNATDIEVGVRMRVQRRLLGMSQSALAQHLGIAYQQVQKYEKGTNRVGASRLQSAAHVLRVPVSYFFGDNVGSTIDNEALLKPQQGGVIVAFLETQEAKDLNLAFAKIASPALRKEIVRLVKLIAISDLSADES